MSDHHYSKMSDEQLAEAFLEISMKQADATGLRDAHTVDKLIAQLRGVKDTLRARGLEQRKVLVPLLNYAAAPEPFAEDRAAQVRLNAAKELLAVVPEQVRATLEDLAAHGPSFQSGSAGMCLQFLQEGVFKPT